MSNTMQLVRALLAHAWISDDHALSVLNAALEREIDPMLYCCMAFDISPATAMARAAEWLKCTYFDRIPDGLSGDINPARLEALAHVRIVRAKVFDRDTVFMAPDFFGLLRLHKQIEQKPRLRSHIVLVPVEPLRAYTAAAAAPALMVEARQNLARKWPYAVAQLELTKPARYGFFVLLWILVGLILAAPHLSHGWLWPLSIFMVGPAMIRLAAVRLNLPPPPRLVRPPDEVLPIYSVLVPLRNEAEMVDQLFSGLSKIDYPVDRLDIKFVVEATSPETVAAVEQRLGQSCFSLVVVPDTAPHTKPKALDYALPLCRGDHVVVFDAEDVPAPDQLWRAAARFAKDPELACLQAPLVIGNGRQNLLTALFAGEYAGLFGVLLPALAHWRLPVPLGGTSNHFDIARLRALGGWDAFNVTEDADIGVRLARSGMKVGVLDSCTTESAPVHFSSWFGQRTRWIKGWMQTFIVHNRHPVQLLAQLGLRSALIFELLTLGMILTPLLHCGMLIGLVSCLLLNQPIIEGSWKNIGYLAIMVLGYVSTLAMTLLGLRRLGNRHLVAQQWLLPAYWVLMALASVKALHQLLNRPFYWFKTPHEPDLRQDGAAEVASAIVEKEQGLRPVA